MATTRTEDGQKYTVKTGTEIQTRRKTEHWTTEEEMEGTNSTLRTKEQGTKLALNEHDDDDDDEGVAVIYIYI